MCYIRIYPCAFNVQPEELGRSTPLTEKWNFARRQPTRAGVATKFLQAMREGRTNACIGM